MTTTDKLGMTLPPDGNTSWGDDIRNALRTLDAALISHYFAENSASHSGLNFAYLGGVYRNDATIVTIAGSAIALTDDTTNYIFVDVSAGAIAANTTGFISGDIPLFTVVAASGAISTVTDNRTLMSLGGGGGSGDYYTKAEIGAVADGTAGADLVGMTPITETGGAATVQAVIEALITKLKAVADSASGADLIGATAITSLGAAATVQAILEAMAPMTTQGDIIYQGTSAPARLAKGMAWQVLTMNSGATTPEWVTPLIVLLEQHTAANSAELAFTVALAAGAYNVYEIEIFGLVSATSGAAIRLQFSTDGGDTYIASDYSWNNIGAGGSVGSAHNDADTAISLANWGIHASAGNTLAGKLTLYIAANCFPRIMGQVSKMYDAGYYSEPELPSGVYKATTAINAFRIFATSGNLSSGTVKLYGKN